jgi:SAM-dependent methyltransferase
VSDQRAHFDAIADVYDDSLPEHVVAHYLRRRAAFVAACCPPGEGLDVGCGTGALAAELAARDYAMTGIDPSAGMLAVLRGRAPSVRALQGSATALPFAAGSFDLVVTVATLHHIAAAEAVRAGLVEMVRVLRPGGRVVVWDHNPRNPYWGRLMARVPQDTGEERLIAEPEIVAGLRAGGGVVLQRLHLGFVPDFTPRPLLGAAAALERAAERTPGLRALAAHNVVVATKPVPQRGAS